MNTIKNQSSFRKAFIAFRASGGQITYLPTIVGTDAASIPVRVRYVRHAAAHASYKPNMVAPEAHVRQCAQCTTTRQLVGTHIATVEGLLAGLPAYTTDQVQSGTISASELMRNVMQRKRLVQSMRQVTQDGMRAILAHAKEAM